jgi:alcohol dehydrogenase class IV
MRASTLSTMKKLAWGDMKPFSFRLKTDMRFGVGITGNIGNLLRDYGFSKVGIIIDAGVLKNKAAHELINNLKETCTIEKIFENQISEPDYDYLDECKKEFLGTSMDCLIGIGGGSTMDLTKGVAALLKNPGKAIQYRGFNLLKNLSLPTVAVPTTAGTGSEVTPYAVFTDRNEKRKLGINSEYNIPRLTILDPLLTLSCPRSVTVSSGMDALTHAVESFVAKGATPISKMFSRNAFSLIFNNLSKIVDDMGNIDLRSKLLLGSHCAGVALMNSGAGPAGAMSYPLGVHYNVPHGLAGAVFLPKVVNFNVQSGCEDYAEIYDLIDNADKNLSVLQKTNEFSGALDALCEKLSIPRRLSQFKVSRKDVDFIVKDTFSGLKGAIEQNPVPFTEKDARRILEEMT